MSGTLNVFYYEHFESGTVNSFDGQLNTVGRFITDLQPVAPRDFFNISKFWKCYGQLSLLIHTHREIASEIDLSLIPGHCGSVLFESANAGILSPKALFYSKRSRSPLYLYTDYNSHDPYPLCCLSDTLSYIRVLSDSGSSLSNDFHELLAEFTDDKS